MTLRTLWGRYSPARNTPSIRRVTTQKCSELGHAKTGCQERATLDNILLAQIEAHKADVFYNLDLDNFDDRFARRLPGSVRARIGWHAAPATRTDWTGYLMVNNFPSILEVFRSRGLRAAYFAPAHDPALDTYAQNEQRDIDVLFVGGYSQYHSKRVAVLEAVAALNGKLRVVFALARSRLNRIAETPLGLLGPLRQYCRPGKNSCRGPGTSIRSRLL